MVFFSTGLKITILMVFIASAKLLSYSQDAIINTLSNSEISVKKKLVDEIIIEGNQKTHKNIILRELRFSEGLILDSISLIQAISQSRTNLLKLPLFNFVTIETLPQDSVVVKIKILVEERWYVWPQLSIINNERNFNTWLQNKDFTKLDYRVAVTQYNVLGLNHILNIGVSFGYTREFSLNYQNIFLDKKQHHFLGINARFFMQKSVFFRTFNNKLESFTHDDTDVMEGRYFAVDYNYRPKYNARHSFILSYNQVLISDSLAISNPEFLGNGQTESNYFEFRYRYIYDKRDSRSYPLHGYFLDFGLTKTGIGFIPENNINLFSTLFSVKQFYQISKKFYGSHSVNIKKSLEFDQPYYYKRGLGYKDFLRGFEYYVVDCEDYYLLKNTLKIELLPQTVSTLNFVPVKKFKKIHYAFYLSAYFDIGYAIENNQEIINNNILPNSLLYSGGLGFDISSYYDKVFRFEYSINSLGEFGFFIHFRASI